jgi:4,5-DOPA dioxygenase extradiol
LGRGQVVPVGALPPLLLWRDQGLWAAEALDSGDVDALVNFATAPAARYAHPTTEHFAPLFVTLGAAPDAAPPPVTTITGYWLGLAKRSIQIP